MSDEDHGARFPSGGCPPEHGLSPRYAVLNPDYPASYWQIAFSTDVGPEKVIPLRILERDVVVWRDSHGDLHCAAAYCRHLGAHIGYGGEVIQDTLRCPFHGWRYNSAGTVVHTPGITGTPRTTACLPTFRVFERFGTIFLWNGPNVPDHEMPDVLADAGLREEDVTFEHLRYNLPFSGQWFAENLPDAAHFAALHRLGTWGDTDVVSISPTRMEYIAHFHDRAPYVTWAELKRNFRRGEMWAVSDVAAGDLRTITYGGGLHLVQLTPISNELAESRQAVTAVLPRVTIAISERLNRLTDRAAFILSFTPVEAGTHIMYFTLFTPRIRNPIVRGLAQPVVRAILTRRNWFPIMQDTALMIHRQEPEKPAYNRFDRALVETRRFWDRRIVGSSANTTDERAPVLISAPEEP